MSQAKPLRPVFDVRAWLHDGADGLPLTTLDRLILLVLASHMGPRGTHAYPGIKRLATVAGVEERSAKRSLARLAGNGLPALIRGAVEHPHIGQAQKWEFTEGFRYMLERVTQVSPTSPERVTEESERVTLEPERVTDVSEEGDRGVPPTKRTEQERKKNEEPILETEHQEPCEHAPETTCLGRKCRTFCSKCNTRLDAVDFDPETTKVSAVG